MLVCWINGKMGLGIMDDWFIGKFIEYEKVKIPIKSFITNTPSFHYSINPRSNGNSGLDIILSIVIIVYNFDAIHL
jgi:hypothetical protein